MKKIILITACFSACILSIQAQTLYGLTYKGGNDGVGALLKFIPSTNNLTVARSFENHAKNPTRNLIQASNGKLYGMTFYGGNANIGGTDFGGGVIFSYDPSTGTYTKLKHFDGTDGFGPSGSLVQASDGKLYGVTVGGGSNYGVTQSYGVIFSFDPSTSTYTKLKDFDNANGAIPVGSLVQASDGKLYGTTERGGSSDQGVIFSFNPSTSAYTKLKDFNTTDGYTPSGGLMQASNGKLYGMTRQGGSGVVGVIFSFDPSTSTYVKLKDIISPGGQYPVGSLVQASDSKLYGMTREGGSNGLGVIFSFDPTSLIYTKLKDFDGINGDHPSGSLIQAGDGKLYGTTAVGGSSNAGVIFSFVPSSSTYTKLKDLDGANGGGPGSPMQASDGKLYGLTSDGGSSEIGVIFSFVPSSSTYTKLKDFGTDGRLPNASLVKADNGKLYGMTYGGGSGGYGGNGVIFSYDPSNSTYLKLKDFDGTNGAHPFGSLVQANDGKLYGMTAIGGSNNVGVIFSFAPASSTYTKLKDLDVTNGSYPFGSLMQAGNGKLYGMTGGSNSDGVIFSFDLSSSTYAKLKEFSGTDGHHPHGNLVQAGNGKLYGMTFLGGSNDFGVIFSFDPASSTYTKLKDFDGTNGRGPRGTLVQAGNGKLYGLTVGGGSNDYGVIFSFDPSTSTYTKLKDFDGTNGSNPEGNLMQAGDGKLYGMTHTGGSSGVGVIFSFDPLTSGYTKLKDFVGTNGASPFTGSGFIEVSGAVTGVTDITNSLHQVKVFPNPAPGSTIISFSLNKPENVSVKIFDANGRTIKMLAHARFEKGQHELIWNTAEISAGLYLLQFDAGDWSETKKITVIN